MFKCYGVRNQCIPWLGRSCMSHFAKLWMNRIQADVLCILVFLHCVALFPRVFISFAYIRNWTINWLSYQRKSKTRPSYCTRCRTAASVYPRHTTVKTRTSEILQNLSVDGMSPSVYWKSGRLVHWRIGAHLRQVEIFILNRIQIDSEQGTLSLGIKQPGCEAHHLSLVSRLWKRGSGVHCLILVYDLMLNSAQG